MINEIILNIFKSYLIKYGTDYCLDYLYKYCYKHYKHIPIKLIKSIYKNYCKENKIRYKQVKDIEPKIKIYDEENYEKSLKMIDIK
jgi:hypothetical protein